MSALVAMDDNTKVVLLALIAGVPSWIAAVFAIAAKKSLVTPSGEPIGKLTEETHAMAHANAALINVVHRKINVDDPPPAPPPTVTGGTG